MFKAKVVLFSASSIVASVLSYFGRRWWRRRISYSDYFSQEIAKIKDQLKVIKDDQESYRLDLSHKAAKVTCQTIENDLKVIKLELKKAKEDLEAELVNLKQDLGAVSDDVKANKKDLETTKQDLWTSSFTSLNASAMSEESEALFTSFEERLNSIDEKVQEGSKYLQLLDTKIAMCKTANPKESKFWNRK
jgi:chromosome segregation ATPase